MEDLFTDGAFNLAFFSDTLLFNDIPVTDKSPHILSLRKKLRLKGVDRLIIKKGVSQGEIKELVTSLATRDAKMSSSQYVTVGVFDLTLKSDVEIQSRVLKLAKAFEDISVSNTLSYQMLEEMIGSFVLELKKESNLLKLLKPVASFSEYTYVHSINVSMITIYLAEFLGLQGEELHDAGIAGLLHDMGKLFIQKEIIEKDSSLTNEEWSAMQLHPIKGGLYLSKVPEIPKIAAVVAFEHHMKYDGSGYRQIKWRMKKQHIISSIVSIADFFDAMRSVRVYREKEKFHVSEILKILKEGSGTFFHPDLVGCFMGAFKDL
jgi:HD-GYP domain-containing protein (c-di-GMP phosphodiesterase class II)